MNEQVLHNLRSKQQKIRQKGEHDWKRFLHVFKQEFNSSRKHRKYGEYLHLPVELSNECDLWETMFDIKIDFYYLKKTVPYLQYAVMLEQRTAFDEPLSILNADETKALKHVLHYVGLWVKAGINEYVHQEIKFTYIPIEQDHELNNQQIAYRQEVDRLRSAFYRRHPHTRQGFNPSNAFK